MINSFFTAVGGMLGFSKGLDNISGNVSNMNTAGYRGSDAFYRAVSGGNGLSVSDSVTRFAEGGIIESSQPLNAAITGEGFFILESPSGDYLFTRNGEFTANQDSELIHEPTGFHVVGFDSDGKLAQLALDSIGDISATQTSLVEVGGSISSNGGPNAPLTFNVVKPDGTVENYSLTLKFDERFEPTPDEEKTEGELNVASQYFISITKQSSGEVVFGERVGEEYVEIVPEQVEEPSQTEGDSAAAEDDLEGDEVDVEPEFKLSDNAVLLRVVDGELYAPDLLHQLSIQINSEWEHSGSYAIEIDLGTIELGDINRLTLTSNDGETSAVPTSQPRYASDGSGTIEFSYSDGISRSTGQLALARVDSLNALRTLDGVYFMASSESDIDFVRAGQNGVGDVEGGKLEGSNVELTAEFADMIVIQRGYQASSQVMNVASQLLESLYNGGGR